MPRAAVYILAAVLGACVGSFLNVLIFRLPRGEEFVRTPSHCMSCGRRLRWYELIPIVSFCIQKGRCRGCGAKLSAQYPTVEALNALVWVLTAGLYFGDWLHSLLYCALFSVLTVLSVIDWRTFEIPDGLNIALLALGVLQLIADLPSWSEYVIGMLCVSVPFLLVWLVTRGAGIGMGDVLLMAASGLLLGWKRILLAVLVGSVVGAVIHLFRMRRGAGRKLAFGPYLSFGIWFSALFGDFVIGAYLSLLGL